MSRGGHKGEGEESPLIFTPWVGKEIGKKAGISLSKGSSIWHVTSGFRWSWISPISSQMYMYILEPLPNES